MLVVIGEGYTVDCDYLIKVSDYMYPRPKLKNVVYNNDEILPIILVECK